MWSLIPANTSVTAYLEVDGNIPWKGRLAFDGTDLPQDSATLEIADGTGRDSITFEFDNNEASSSGNAIEVVEMVASVPDNLAVSDLSWH